MEISEVLFNELAFFRMMRSLDGGTGSLSVDESMEGQDTVTYAMDDEEEDEVDELGEASEETRELDNGGSSTSVSAADQFGREVSFLIPEFSNSVCLILIFIIFRPHNLL